MRTKTLLVAAAALVAGAISSQAQVYSANIVGYANVATPTAYSQYLLSIPFAVGVSNGANEVFGTSLPENSLISVWNVAGYYDFYQTDSGSPTGWSLPDYTPVPPPALPVGKGFFLQPTGDGVTNTFVGAVAVNVGTSNVVTFPTGYAQYLVGSPVPYAGSLTNGTSSGGGINLNNLPENSLISIWNVAGYYDFYQTDSGSPTGWSLPDYTPVPAPSLSVGQGFFIQPTGDNATWTVGL